MSENSYKLKSVKSVDWVDKPVAQGSEEELVLKRFDEIYAEAKNAKAEPKRMMEQSFLSFRSILSDYAMSQRSIEHWGLAIFVPVTFQVVMSIQAQLNGRPPMYRVGPLNSPADLKVSRPISDLSRAEFRRAKALRTMADAVQLSLIFGTAPIRAVYDVDRREVMLPDGFETVEDKEGNKIKKLKYKKTIKEFNRGWKLVIDHPLQVYVPAVHTSNVEDLPFYIYRELVDVRKEKEFYEAHPELAYQDNYKYLKAGGDLTDDLDVYWKEDPMYAQATRYPGSKSDVYAPNTASSETQKVNREFLVEKFRVYDIEKDLWYVIENGRVIECHPNPLSSKKLPVVFMRDYKIVNSIWGLGEPQLIRYLQMEANALHTLALDGTKYATNGVFAVNDMYLKNPSDMSVYPGKIFHLKNLPNVTIDQIIQSFNMPDVKSSVFRMMGVNDQLVGRTTGTGSAILGGDPGANNPSATESNNLKAAATTRIYERARAIEQENLVDIIDLQIKFMADFYDEPLISKISDERFIKFVPGDEKDYPLADKALDLEGGFEAIIYSSDLEKGFDVVIEGESTLPISKRERREEGMQLLKIASETRRPPTSEEMQADPQIMQKFPNGLPILDARLIAERIVMLAFTTIDNPDEFLWKDSPTQDRKRGVGRPEDVLNPDALNAASAPTVPGMDPGGPQPANLGVNADEAMNANVAQML